MMKQLSLMTLLGLLSLAACSHHHKHGKSCCSKDEKKVSCEKKDCKHEDKKACCEEADHCKKKS